MLKLGEVFLYERKDKGRIGAYRVDCVIQRLASSGSAARAIILPIVFFSRTRTLLFPRSQFENHRTASLLTSSRLFLSVPTSLATHVPREMLLARGPA